MRPKIFLVRKYTKTIIKIIIKINVGIISAILLLAIQLYIYFIKFNKYFIFLKIY